MPSHPHRQPWRRRLSVAFAARARSYRSRPVAWRLLAPAVFVLAGILFVTSMVSSQGTDLRAGRYDDLNGLADSEAHGLASLRTRASGLAADVERLSRESKSRSSERVSQRVEQLSGPVGLEPVAGPGVTITLDDAPQEELRAAQAAGEDVRALLVHQQDIQAVANALWAGGAEAMTIQGQRVVATTGIKCVGNVVILHGVPYSPPYKISAIGPTTDMLSAVNRDRYIDIYLQYAKAVDLGWQVEEAARLRMPGYDGPTELDYARPLGG